MFLLTFTLRFLILLKALGPKFVRVIPDRSLKIFWDIAKWCEQISLANFSNYGNTFTRVSDQITKSFIFIFLLQVLLSLLIQ